MYIHHSAIGLSHEFMHAVYPPSCRKLVKKASNCVMKSHVRPKLVNRVVCVCCVCVMSSSSSNSDSSSPAVLASLNKAIARADAAERKVKLAEAHCREAMADVAESRSHIKIYMAERGYRKKDGKKNKKKRKIVEVCTKDTCDKDDNDKDDGTGGDGTGGDGTGGEMPRTPEGFGAACVAAA
jgi:hypothetical protein